MPRASMTVSAVGGSLAVGPAWMIALSLTNSPPSAILRRVASIVTSRSACFRSSVDIFVSIGC